VITKDELLSRFDGACQEIRENEEILTDIDSRFGDADFGVTMIRITDAIEGAMHESQGSIREMMVMASDSVVTVSGGSSVALWGAWLKGLGEGAPDRTDATDDEFRAMFASGLRSIDKISGAKIGDKTMMDALIPASDAIAASLGDIGEMLDMASLAAFNGAEFSKQVPSKFGKAKKYGEKTIGTPDAGAMSVSFFFMGLARF